jgi:ketosteroid isomerase-like protein
MYSVRHTFRKGDIMKILRAVALVSMCLPTLLCSSNSSSSHRAAVLVRAERDFATLSIREGMKPAFMEFLADSGIVFRPHPVNGKEATAGRPNPAITLDWVPSFADIAVGEDLGYTTGPWIVTDRSGQDRPPGYGTYLSVWKKQPNQEWKVVLDIGTSSPSHSSALKDVQTTFSEGDGSEWKVSDQGPEALFALDREFSGPESAAQKYLRYAGKHIRLIREGEFPIIGADSAGNYLEKVRDLISCAPIGGELSRAGDLGYTYGTYQLNREADERNDLETGYYVHIWKRQDSSFKLVVDLLSPAPEE